MSRSHRAAQARVEGVADAVAEQIEGEHRDGDGGAGEQHQPRRNEPGVERIGQSSMLPQVGVGGGMPTPRKPSEASISLALARRRSGYVR